MAKNAFCEATVTFDLQQSHPNQFTLESKSAFAPKLKKITHDIPEILHSQKSDVYMNVQCMDRQPIMPSVLTLPAARQ